MKNLDRPQSNMFLSAHSLIESSSFANSSPTLHGERPDSALQVSLLGGLLTRENSPWEPTQDTEESEYSKALFANTPWCARGDDLDDDEAYFLDDDDDDDDDVDDDDYDDEDDDDFDEDEDARESKENDDDEEL